MCALLNFKKDTVIHAKQTRRFLCILWINYDRHLLTMPANPNPISSRALTICKPANVGKFWTSGILYIMALIVSFSTVWTTQISFLGNRGFVHQHNLRFNCNTRNVLRKYKKDLNRMRKTWFKIKGQPTPNWLHAFVIGPDCLKELLMWKIKSQTCRPHFQ